MYQAIIKEEMARQGFTGKYEPRHIEGYMRLQYGCLDGLSKAQFKKEVSICMECVDADGIENAESLAKSYGL